MTLQTQQVHVAELEHVRIRTAVDHVAGHAAIDFHGRVLVNEGTLLVGVAFEADDILRGVRSHLFRELRSMWIVAIGALNQAFVNAMMKRHGEFGFASQVAGVAQFWLRLGQQVFSCYREMRGMAGDAANAVESVQGVKGVHLLGSSGMARQAPEGYGLYRCVLESENFRRVAPRIDVRFAGAMACFASVPLRAFVFV